MKFHLIESDEPLASGVDITALCGQLVSKAEWVILVDGDMACPLTLGEVANPFFTCKKCFVAQCGKRYGYMMVDGQLARHP